MSNTIRNISDLDTPCLVLDMDLLERNLGKMQDVVGVWPIDLRGCSQ